MCVIICTYMCVELLLHLVRHVMCAKLNVSVKPGASQTGRNSKPMNGRLGPLFHSRIHPEWTFVSQTGPLEIRILSSNFAYIIASLTHSLPPSVYYIINYPWAKLTVYVVDPVWRAGAPNRTNSVHQKVFQGGARVFPQLVRLLG